MKSCRSPFLFPLQTVAAVIGPWIEDHRRHLLDYVLEENRVLREMLGPRKPRFTDRQRRRLALVGKLLGRSVLSAISTLVTPDTILAWHRRLVERKATRLARGRRRLPETQAVTKLVLRMVRENPSWGYDRIQGALKNLGYTMAPNTVRNILRRNGIDPAPGRTKRTTWSRFLKTHAPAIFAADFFTTEVRTLRGLVTYYTFFVIHHATRTVDILGTTVSPDSGFMVQIARFLTDPIDGFLRNAKYLILDRDTKFCAAFRTILSGAGIRCLNCPPRAPNCNAIAERFVRSIKSECLDRTIVINETHLRTILREYAAHYNAERNHQGIGNVLIAPQVAVGHRDGPIVCRKRMNGTLNFYFRRPAA